MRFVSRALALSFLTAVLPIIGPAPAEAIPGDIAVLQGLDKITARISTFEAPLNEPVRFGSLQIIARACDKKPPEEPPESTAFLEIVDIRPDSPAVELFTGWMFASSPAISAVEHPVYDVWVVDCKKASSSESETAPE
ncbi:DUF2155 domain-containing protein [Pelagibius marinus]|uniref:DUF2155 domain-containing protein n=1 Tax=Pelagibius marinus TaxID=2762760 RepID=UPI001D05448C|nr:DUF2155 domain-containing protein [Pelagibius marinus]